MTHEIFKNAKKVALFLEEKERGRAVLRAFIATNPVREGVFPRLMVWNSQRSIVKRLFLYPMPIVLIIALLLGGGATFAAEQSLPGDILYPVKINVNEGVRSLFAVSDDSEARLQADLAERRLEEAEKLASDGRLDDDVRARIEANFENHAARVEDRIEAMKNDSDGNTNAVAVGSQFEASLRAHEEILKRLSEEKKGSEDGIASIVAMVRDASDGIDRVRAEAEAGLTFGSNTGTADENFLKERAERKQREAEQKIKDVEAYMQKNPSAAVATYVEVREKLTLARKLLETGKEYMSLKAYGKAFVTFQESWNVAQKAWIVLTGSAAIQISVGSTGTGDFGVVVPPQPAPTPGIVPTPGPAPMPVPEPSATAEEAQKRIEQASNKISEVRRFLSVRMGVMTEEMAKKVEAYLVAADKSLAQAKEYFGLAAYSKSIVMSRQAKELAEFALKIAIGEVTDPSVPPTTSSGLVPVVKTTASGEIEIELEDADGSGKFR